MIPLCSSRCYCLPSLPQVRLMISDAIIHNSSTSYDKRRYFLPRAILSNIKQGSASTTTLRYAFSHSLSFCHFVFFEGVTTSTRIYAADILSQFHRVYCPKGARCSMLSDSLVMYDCLIMLSGKFLFLTQFENKDGHQSFGSPKEGKKDIVFHFLKNYVPAADYS
jgi:hypothetical protein